MPASTSIINGNDFLLKVGGNAIGGGSDAELTIEQALEDVTNDTAPNWEKNLPSIRSWSLSFTSMYLESSSEINGSAVSVTIGGTAIKGITEATFNFAVDTSDIVNSTSGYDREIAPKTRRVSLDVAFDYYDPAGTGAGALDDVLDEAQGTTSSGLATVLTFGSSASVSGTARPENVRINKTQSDHVRGSMTLKFTGTVTDASTGQDTGMAALFTALFDSDLVTSLTALIGTSTVDNTEYTGTVYPTDLTVSVPYVGPVSVDGTLTGSGALTKQATTA